MATTKLLDLPSEVLLAVALPLDTRDRWVLPALRTLRWDSRCAPATAAAVPQTGLNSCSSLLCCRTHRRCRACLFAACRRLRELGASAPSVWEELRGVALAYPSQALRFARWLAGEGRAAHVRRLHLALRYPVRNELVPLFGLHGWLAGTLCSMG